MVGHVESPLVSLLRCLARVYFSFTWFINMNKMNNFLDISSLLIGDVDGVWRKVSEEGLDEGEPAVSFHTCRMILTVVQCSPSPFPLVVAPYSISATPPQATGGEVALSLSVLGFHSGCSLCVLQGELLYFLVSYAFKEKDAGVVQESSKQPKKQTLI